MINGSCLLHLSGSECCCRDCSVEDTALIGWDHILDVDEGVFSSMDLEKLESVLDQIS